MNKNYFYFLFLILIFANFSRANEPLENSHEFADYAKFESYGYDDAVPYDQNEDSSRLEDPDSCANLKYSDENDGIESSSKLNSIYEHEVDDHDSKVSRPPENYRDPVDVLSVANVWFNWTEIADEDRNNSRVDDPTDFGQDHDKGNDLEMPTANPEISHETEQTSNSKTDNMDFSNEDAIDNRRQNSREGNSFAESEYQQSQPEKEFKKNQELQQELKYLFQKDKSLFQGTLLTSEIQLSEDSKKMLAEIGLKYSFETVIQNPTTEQKSLFSWAKHLINKTADLYFVSTDVVIKAACAEITILCAAAHDLATKGEIRKGSDLLKVGWAACNKYDSYRKIYWKAIANRASHIARNPIEFVSDQVKGIGHTIVAVAKASKYAEKVVQTWAFPTIWPRDILDKQKIELLGDLMSSTEQTAHLVHTAVNMSLDDWDKTIAGSMQVLGTMTVDVAAGYPLFYYAPTVFKPIPKVYTKLVDLKYFDGLTETASKFFDNKLEFIFNKAKQAFVLEEEVAIVFNI